MDNSWKYLSLLAILWFGIANANATIVYDESVSGDLSDDPTSATFIDLEVGENDIIGTIGPFGGDLNDFIEITLDDVVSISFVSLVFDPTDTTDAIRFKNCDTSITTCQTSDALASIPVTSGNLGVNLIPILSSIAPGGVLSDVFGSIESEGPTTYTLRVVKAGTVTEPSTLALLGLSLFGIGFFRRKS